MEVLEPENFAFGKSQAYTAKKMAKRSKKQNCGGRRFRVRAFRFAERDPTGRRGFVATLVLSTCRIIIPPGYFQ